jgi:hypothetical protein
MKNVFSLLLIFSLLVLGFKNVVAHGVHIDFIMKSHVVTAKAYFSKNSPMANSEISIFTPGSDIPFQTGKTDPHGNFVFLPDKAGTWKVVVDDGMGHKGTSQVEITESFFTGDEQMTVSDTHQHEHEQQTDLLEDHHHEHSHEEIPMVYKIIFGISMIFGITGIFYGFKKRKS